MRVRSGDFLARQEGRPSVTLVHLTRNTAGKLLMPSGIEAEAEHFSELTVDGRGFPDDRKIAERYHPRDQAVRAKLSYLGVYVERKGADCNLKYYKLH